MAAFGLDPTQPLPHHKRTDYDRQGTLLVRLIHLIADLRFVAGLAKFVGQHHPQIFFVLNNQELRHRDGPELISNARLMSEILQLLSRDLDDERHEIAVTTDGQATFTAPADFLYCFCQQRARSPQFPVRPYACDVRVEYFGNPFPHAEECCDQGLIPQQVEIRLRTHIQRCQHDSGSHTTVERRQAARDNKLASARSGVSVAACATTKHTMIQNHLHEAQAQSLVQVRHYTEQSGY